MIEDAHDEHREWQIFCTNTEHTNAGYNVHWPKILETKWISAIELIFI